MTIALPTLWKHQEDLRDRTRAALAKHGRVILCANPGFGKTRCSKWILGTAGNRAPLPNQTGRSLFCVHRRGLVDNASDSFAEDPKLPHAVIMSGREPAYGRRIQVASIDSLLSWFIEDKQYTTDITFDLIVFDECHSHHDKLARFLAYHDAKREALGQHPAYVIGLSATPQARGLADVYKEIVLGPSTEWLISNKFLSPFRYFQGTQGKLGLLVKRGNEFTSDSEAAAMEGLAGELVRDWKKFADGRPTVGFFPRRQHAQDAQEALSAAGLRVEYVDGDTDDDARRRIFRALNNHDIDYICNVQVVERGTDIPRIGCVQLCVAIGSNVRYRQIIGRGSRVHPDKTDCKILDHGGNVLRHGFFEDDPKWSLDRSEKTPSEHQTRPSIECPKCHAIYRGGKCKACGYEPSADERKGAGLDFNGKELVEIKEEERKKKAKLKSAEQLMVQTLFRAGRSNRTWKQAVGIFYDENKAQGTNYRVPKTVLVDGHRYRMLQAYSSDGGRKVGQLFPFTVEKGSHGGDYLETAQSREEPAF
jgi:superfamily II DNA or RNA helicase